MCGECVCVCVCVCVRVRECECVCVCIRTEDGYIRCSSTLGPNIICSNTCGRCMSWWVGSLPYCLHWGETSEKIGRKHQSIWEFFHTCWNNIVIAVVCVCV